MKLFRRPPAQNFSYGEGSFTGSETSQQQPLKFVFFGSGPVAAKSLELLAKNFKIEAIVTKPKPLHHKGEFPVIELAKKLNIRTETVANKQELSELLKSRPFQSKLAVLIDFGIIVDQDVIDYFSLGIINSHFSLLPLWRGADPIAFAILAGDKKTGVSLMLLEEYLDTGKLLVQKSLAIDPNDTTGSLTNKLISLSNDLLSRFLPDYLAGKVRPRSQSHPNRATYSRKLTKQDGVIDWQKPAEVLEREIRAFSDWPKSRANIAGKDVIITSAHVIKKSGVAGDILAEGKSLIVFTGKDALQIDRLKPAGKSEMTAEAFLAGYGQLL